MLVIPSCYNSTTGPLSLTAEMFFKRAKLCMTMLFQLFLNARHQLRTCVHVNIPFTKQILINNRVSAFGPLPVRSFTLTRFDLPSLFHQGGQEVTEALLHTTSPFGPAPLKLSNSMVPDEDHSLSCTYLICSICIPSTDMIFGKLRSRRGVLTRAV